MFLGDSEGELSLSEWNTLSRSRGRGDSRAWAFPSEPGSEWTWVGGGSVGKYVSVDRVAGSRLRASNDSSNSNGSCSHGP